MRTTIAGSQDFHCAYWNFIGDHRRRFSHSIPRQGSGQIPDARGAAARDRRNFPNLYRNRPAAGSGRHRMTKLSPIAIEKPWGRTRLPPPFEAPPGERIGEIWFPAPQGVEMPLLVKYLFSSEKLSIQVHPSDEQARARGLPGGKEECWYILEAEPGALLGIGTTKPLSHDEVRQAALTGEIEGLIEWHPAEAGMLFHIPPGTIHTIGGGISLIEIQQNSDTTYRLYDYGRPRELHLDDGVAVANAVPFPAGQSRIVDPGRSATLLATPHFTLAQIVGDSAANVFERSLPALIIPIIGTFSVDGANIGPGEVMLGAEGARIEASQNARALIAWTNITTSSH